MCAMSAQHILTDEGWLRVSNCAALTKVEAIHAPKFTHPPLLRAHTHAHKNMHTQLSVTLTSGWTFSRVHLRMGVFPMAKSPPRLVIFKCAPHSLIWHSMSSSSDDCFRGQPLWSAFNVARVPYKDDTRGTFLLTWRLVVKLLHRCHTETVVLQFAFEF